ncbi:MAG: histidine--tRNA ligase [Sedimentisphaerales bacterium]|nr:histidine--tRNA ligase [Sedimentisphaerales bacterium]
MKIPPVKGTRDFYPQEMAIHNWIVDGWKRASLRNGFEEYDGPIFEYLQMYQIKSGDEIVEQLFSFKDRGDRDLAIRPEITPTLARMVNQRINTLPKPIKWFSVPRLCRAERPQKGRLREFFQWNIDIIGEDSVLADAEVIFTTVDYLREVGLTPNDIKVKISSRKFLSAVLKKIGISEEKLNSLYGLLDKKTKLPAEAFSEALIQQVGERISEQVISFMGSQSVTSVENIVKPDAGGELDIAIKELEDCASRLGQMGISDYCVFDPGIVRGLAYYTGIVFEVHDIQGDLRAICGGGRFDNLLHDFGGPKITATGMGMGDCVLEILLSEKGLLNQKISARSLDYFVLPVADNLLDDTIKLVAQLRTLGFKTIFSYKSGSLSKQLKTASERNAKYCIIIGDEFKAGDIVLKDMSTGNQKTVPLNEFLANPGKF